MQSSGDAGTVALSGWWRKIAPVLQSASSVAFFVLALCGVLQYRVGIKGLSNVAWPMPYIRGKVTVFHSDTGGGNDNSYGLRDYLHGAV